jgi:hypothetical protein
MSSPDPFSGRFDAIEIDPARAPSQGAIEHAFALVAPREDTLTPAAAAPDFATPGFYLIDDAGGRFQVDRDFGVISLKDESILETEHNAVHTARLRVIEQSGASYVLEMQLRLTGRVPQMVGAEDFAHIAGLAAAPSVQTPAPISNHTVSWSRFAAAHDTHPASTLGDEAAAFGSLLSVDMPTKGGSTAFLALTETLPAPSPRNAAWTL